MKTRPNVLGAAATDLYQLGDVEPAIVLGERLIADYPDSEVELRRSAWTVIAHASFDLDSFEKAENAYLRVLELLPPEDQSVAAITENLAASIYRQGERAAEGGDDETAATHFLRIAEAAPSSKIRPAAEFDAAAALIRLKQWSRAAVVLESFRSVFPEHELGPKVTRQLAFVHRENGDPARAAKEYLRVSDEASAPELRAEALTVAGDLYVEAEMLGEALSAYQRFVTDFTDSLEAIVVTRHKMSELHSKLGDERRRLAELREIVKLDASAGEKRTALVRRHGGEVCAVARRGRLRDVRGGPAHAALREEPGPKEAPHAEEPAQLESPGRLRDR